MMVRMDRFPRLPAHAPAATALLLVVLAAAGAASAATLNVRVAASTDDAEQNLTSNAMNLTSTDMELGSEDGFPQLVGLRFTTVDIDENDTICAAWIEFTVSIANPGASPYDYDPAEFTIQAEAIDDAPGLGAGADNLSNRTRTAASATWSPGLWTTVGAQQDSADITAVIEELIGTHGFQNNDDMVFLIEGHGSRKAESRNGGGAADAPRLHIEYDDDPACGSPTTYEEAVPNNNSDSEEDLRDGSVDRGSNDLNLGTSWTNKQANGMRFLNITIPRYATINSAFLDLVADENHVADTWVRILGQDADDAATFAAAASDLTSRATTSATVDWDDIPLWTVGTTYTSPDLATIIQEIVDRAGWASGNDLVLTIVGTGHRTAESFNGVAASAPLLRIDYTPPAPVIGVTKSSTVISDPVNGASNPKRLPGAVVEYVIAVSNSGRISPDVGTVIMSDVLPAEVDLTMATYSASSGCVVSCAGTDGSRPARITEGSTASTLTLDYVSVGDGGDDVQFLDGGGSPVTPPTSGTAPAVRQLVLTPSGTFAANPFGPPYPSFELRYRVTIR